MAENPAGADNVADAENVAVAEYMADAEAGAGATAVVAGVDGSPDALQAAAWAAQESAARNEPLRLVHAYSWPLMRIPSVLAAMGPADGLREQAQEFLQEAEAIANEAMPGLDIDALLIDGFPAPVLVRQSASASLVVVASRRLGALGRFMAGSTAVELSARSACPVAAIRPFDNIDQGDGPVGAGIDGSPPSIRALHEAADTAARGKRELVVVHALSGKDPDLDANLDASRAEDILRPVVERHPDIEFQLRTVSGHPAAALVELSAETSRIVVGARGRGGFTGMLLGSVSQSLLDNAHCPVVICPATSAER